MEPGAIPPQQLEDVLYALESADLEGVDEKRVPEAEMAAWLAGLTRMIELGQQAGKLREKLICRAVRNFGWTHEATGAACPISQPAVTQILKRGRS